MPNEEELMSGRILAALALALAFTSDPAFAALCHEDASPLFTASEHAIIDRNAALAALVGRDPGLVRCVLDAIAAAGASRSGAGTKQRKYERAPDPARNPDLDYLGRSSPEAAHDLFQLIKRASRGSKGNGR
jgi:hypothetical protein